MNGAITSYENREACDGVDDDCDDIISSGIIVEDYPEECLAYYATIDDAKNALD